MHYLDQITHGMIYLTQKGYITHIIAPPREIIENKLMTWPQ